MAMLGGSHAYGTPGLESDVDLVLTLSMADEAVLRRALELPPCGPIIIGRLNLIVARTPAQYTVWVRGIKALKAMAPVTRVAACDLFKRMFAVAGERQWVNSGTSHGGM